MMHVRVRGTYGVDISVEVEAGTTPSPAAAAAFNFCISNLELYGYLHRLEAVVVPVMGDGANIAMEETAGVGKCVEEGQPGMETV